MGYGIYWYCLELIARNVDKHNLTFELEHDAELIADDFKLSREIVEEMMSFMVNLGLFENSHGVITCLKMATRTDEYTQKVLKEMGVNHGLVGAVSGQSRIKSELREENRREENRTDNSNTNVLLGDSDADAAPSCPHQEIIAAYHEILPMCPRVRDWTKTRAQQLRTRWHEDKSRQNLDYWRRFFEYVAESDFLTGRANAPPGKAPFIADLEWMTKSSNFVKIREGKYENRR